MAPERPTTQKLVGSIEARHAQMESCVRELLYWLDPNPDRDGLIDTPDRVARALLEMTAGNSEDPAEILNTCFDVACDNMVVVRNIAVNSLCEHHVLPFVGRACVAYIPKKRVVGLSKIARLVQAFSRRLQVQERLTMQVADAMMEHLQPLGVGVIIEASHACMGHRGVKDPDAKMITSSLRGAIKDDPKSRAEFTALANG